MSKWPKRVKHRNKVLAKVYRPCQERDSYRVVWKAAGTRQMKSFRTYAGAGGAKEYADELVKELARKSAANLLRFADLTMVVPNTLYPMFIVAPKDRRNRVREELARPTFRHLHLDEEVKYLSYESVRTVHDFFVDEGKGLSVDVLTGRSEVLTGK
jgi:hypothetical protein